MFRTVQDIQSRSRLIKCEAIETGAGIKLGDTVTHVGIEGKFPPTSGVVIRIEYWLDYDLSYYRLKIATSDTGGYVEAAERYYTKGVIS